MHNYHVRIFSEKKVYIGGGLSEAQLLWILPIVYGYCKKKNINSIILENKISKKLFDNKIISKILNKFKISILKKKKFFFFFNFIIFILLRFIKIIILLIFLKKESLKIKKFSWFDYQCYHAIYDISQLNIKDGYFKVFYFSKFLSIIKVYFNIYLAKKLVNNNVTTAFLGHSVYGSRAMMAFLRRKNISIINQAFDCLYKQKKFTDRLWNFPEKKYFSIFRKKKKIIKEASIYWNRRILGVGNYEDSNLAFSVNKNIKKNSLCKNLVMLHIFRDSPFNSLDKKRIFFDYYDWILNTLKILKESNENWIFKEHPSAYKWGENSSKTFKSLYNEIYGKVTNNNIKYLDKFYSNKLIFKHVKRIITFSGTSHIEAACFGVKPIVISDVSLSLLDKQMVIKPKNINEYKRYILNKTDNLDLKLTKKQINMARILLFYNENVQTLKKDLDSFPVYKNDNFKRKDTNFNNIYNKLEYNKNFLENLGMHLATNLKNTISKKYLKYLENYLKK